MGRQLPVHAGATALILAIWASSATAAPHGKAAKAQFDRGVKAYTKGDYVAAEAAFSKAAALESDVETLFALAQTERKLDRCDKAIDLYIKLLAKDLPDENKQAVQSELAECNDIVAANNKPAEPTPPPASPPPTEPPPPATTAKPEAPPPIAQPQQPPPPAAPEGRPWYRDPIGDALTGVGAISLGFGAVMLVSAHSASQSQASAKTYADFKSYSDKAQSRGELGVAGLAVGGALVTAGIFWYATHGHHDDAAPVTGWLGPHGAGIGFSRAF